MKTKNEILKDLMCILAELQSGIDDKYLEEIQATKLSVLYDILGEDVPEEYWEQIEEWTI